MLLIEKNVLNMLGEEGFDIIALRNTEPITREEFDKLKGNFEERIKGKNHDGDKNGQFFSRKNFDDLLKVTNIHKVAFVFMASKNDKSLSVAMLGMDDKKNFLFDLIIESQKAEKGKEILYRDFKEGTDRYIERMKDDNLDFYPCRDMGILHEIHDDKGFFDKFLRTIDKKVTLFFGVERNELQTTMFKGDKISVINIPVNEEEYAFDKGSGCCPQQP